MVRSERRRPDQVLREFLQEEASGGVVLVAAALVALVWINASDSYESLWHHKLTLGFGGWSLTEDLRHWVNDGLMALFFFVVGLEIKRELVDGELKDPRAAAVPVAAAIGGVLLPAAIFVAWTTGTDHASGWGIPMATDIAFAVGVIALLGSRVPGGAKLFLLTIAIVDDILAIAVIALFYSEAIHAPWLAGAAGCIALVLLLRVVGVAAIWPYVLVGLGLWFCTLESGVHATLAGVVLGLLTPTGEVKGREVLELLEHRLHPVSAFAVVPLFALANAGVEVSADGLREAATSPLTWAIFTGLIVGKTIGIGVVATVMTRAGWGVLPEGVRLAHAWGIAALGGIGFTVSLFISDLAFDDTHTIDIAKIGIFAASLLAAAIGAIVLLKTDANEENLRSGHIR